MAKAGGVFKATVGLYEQFGPLRVRDTPISEQAIMDWELIANRNGHIACTHGGESLAGLITAREMGIVNKDDIAVIDSTAHALKFSGFQEMYFQNQFPNEYAITPDDKLVNKPIRIDPASLEAIPQPGKPLTGEAFKKFINPRTEGGLLLYFSSIRFPNRSHPHCH